MRRIYLDYAATTPVNKKVLEAMFFYFGEKFGNPSSIHWFGQEAAAAVFNARKKIADLINADFRDIIFTGSATEANNLALRGTFSSSLTSPQRGKKSLKIITTAIEHSSILETCRDLEEQGVEVVYLPVDKWGFVGLRALKKELDERTILVSVGYANGEIGAVQEIKKISRLLAEYRSRKSEEEDRQLPFFHTDAVQALQFLSCDVGDLGVDLMTLSAHKIYGPKGIGLLYVRDSVQLKPMIAGGGQERGKRAGTENTAAIVGFGKAVELAEKNRIKEAKEQAVLRDGLWAGIQKVAPAARLNGPPLTSGRRLPNNLNVYFPKKPAQDLLVELDLRGVAVSPGAACAARLAEPSYVIAALGHKNRSRHSLRLTVGKPTTAAEIERVLRVFRRLKP